MVPPCLETMVSLILLLLPNNSDFLFHPTTQINLMLFTYIIDYQTSKVLVRNTSNHILHFLHCYKVSYLIDIIYDNYFLINAHSCFDSATSPPSLQQLPGHSANPPLLPINSSLETILNNRIRLYRNIASIRQIAKLMVEYPIILKSQDFV